MLPYRDPDSSPVIWETFHDPNCLHADAHHLADQAHDVAGIVFAVRVGLAFDLVLVNDPVECRARPETVLEGFRRDAGQGQRFVHLERLAIGAQLHFGDSLGVGDIFVLDGFQRPGIERFIFDVLPLADRWTVVETSRREEFEPLKNATGPDSPQSVRQAISNLAADWLEQAGIRVPRNDQGDAAVSLEISPLYALDAAELKTRVTAELRVESATYLSE